MTSCIVALKNIFKDNCTLEKDTTKERLRKRIDRSYFDFEEFKFCKAFSTFVCRLRKNNKHIAFYFLLYDGTYIYYSMTTTLKRYGCDTVFYEDRTSFYAAIQKLFEDEGSFLEDVNSKFLFINKVRKD